MKKIFLGTALALALSVSSFKAMAGAWIYTGTQYDDVDEYAKNALDKSYMPVLEAKYGNMGSAYATGIIKYNQPTNECFTLFQVVAALDTMEGNGDVTIFHDSGVQRTWNIQKNVTPNQCLKQFKKTVDSNFDGFKRLLANQ